MVSLRGTNQEFGRPYNRRIVLEAIRLHGPIERADIARRVGLTVQTVANIIRELEDADLVTGARGEPKGRGSPATSLSINPAGGYTLGLHVAQFRIEAAVVDLSGTISSVIERRIDADDPEAAFTAIGEMIAELSRGKKKTLLGVGMAMPGPFDVDSMSFVGPTTLQGWRGFPVAERLAEVSPVPAFIEADSAAAALGERLHGAGKTIRDFFYLYFGIGLGGCMVHEGVAVRGAFRNAGEIGHVPLIPDGERCACGNHGCVERYVSLEAYYRRSPVIGRAGWIAEAAPVFRSAVATIENLFDPETIIVGGIAEDDVLAELVAAAEPLANSVSNRKERAHPRIIRSANGHDAVLRGAAAVALVGVLSPQSGLLFAQETAASSRNPTFARKRVA
jgi:predicted NBD/HSP70 family sugar kinase